MTFKNIPTFVKEKILPSQSAVTQLTCFVPFDTRRPMMPRQIINLRKALGLTQQRLADMIGSQRHTISRWETGEHIPRGGYLKALRELQKKAKAKAK